MKVVFINGSPKKNCSASDYLLKLQTIFLKDKIISEKLRTKNDQNRILKQIETADIVIFSIPLYVDSIPSHILSFLVEMEHFCKRYHLKLKIYAIANNGFIEGKQNQTLFHVLENFCIRSNIEWCGGIGIGGGVMLNALKFVFFIEIAIFLISVFISGIFYNEWVPVTAIHNLIMITSIIFFLHLGVFFYMIRLGRKINSGSFADIKYTRILIPSFIFILFADMFFIVVSIFKGGLFHGWLKKK